MTMTDFPHIPTEEQKEKWFLLIKPLVQARSLRPNPQNSKLLQTLNNKEGIRTWQDIKSSMEAAFKHVTQSERIFSRASQINTDPDPDGVIDDMFSELRAIPYLLCKGFKNIEYNRRDGLDFSVEFDSKIYNIEVAYIRGPSFKTQKPVCESKVTHKPVFELASKKLINRLKSICSDKEDQVRKNGGTPSNSLILVISDLDEMYEPWLNHDTFQGKHPILGFVLSRKIPTIIFCPGTVYEPDTSSLEHVFGKLRAFDWDEFSSQKF